MTTYTTDPTNYARTLAGLNSLTERNGNSRALLLLNLTDYPGGGRWTPGTCYNVPKTLPTRTGTDSDGNPRTEYGVQIRFSPDHIDTVRLVCLSQIEGIQEAPPEDNG